METEGLNYACTSVKSALYMYQLTKERSDCSVDPLCSKYVG